MAVYCFVFCLELNVTSASCGIFKYLNCISSKQYSELVQGDDNHSDEVFIVLSGKMQHTPLHVKICRQISLHLETEKLKKYSNTTHHLLTDIEGELIIHGALLGAGRFNLCVLIEYLVFYLPVCNNA